MSSWYIEGDLDNDGKVQTFPLKQFPQILGRDPQLACTVTAPSVSRRHAQIFQKGQALWLEDLGSSNGTFVNRRQILDQTTIDHGDVIHLGQAELRILDREHMNAKTGLAASPSNQETCVMHASKLSEKFPFGVRELERLLAQRQINMVFQPIIRNAGMERVGFEILGRGASSDLPPSPLELFRIAESVGLEVALSELMRDTGVATAVATGLSGDLLVNTHPREMENLDRLLSSLHLLRKNFPKAPITLEIHEQSVTNDWNLLKNLKAELDQLTFKLAFDDFGVGQSRLMEMVEAKPDLIKFDHAMIDGIDHADTSRVNLLKHLKNLAVDLGINTLAECVSNEAEYLTCKNMGFEYYQGFYFGRPAAAEHWLSQHTRHQTTHRAIKKPRH